MTLIWIFGVVALLVVLVLVEELIADHTDRQRRDR
jgi:hypothetical protein